MKQEFENIISKIITILNKRITIIYIITSIFLIITVVLLILNPLKFFYWTIACLLTTLTFCLQFPLKYHKKKLNELLVTYKDNPQNTYDSLYSIVNQYHVFKNNHLVRLYFKRIIYLHNQALLIIKDVLMSI